MFELVVVSNPLPHLPTYTQICKATANARKMERSPQQSYHPQARQPGLVPFLWEEKPGTPKKEWKSDMIHVTSVPSPSPKLVVSVPFNWEEEPGKPIISPSRLLQDSSFLPLPPSQLAGFASPAAYSKSKSCSTTIRGKLRAIFQRTNPFLSSSEEEDSSCDDDDDDDHEMLEFDFRAFDSNADDSYMPAPSLLANCILGTTVMSGAVPVQSNENLNLQTSDYDQHENWAISVSDSTRRCTDVGTNVLEFLFPLFPPDSGFLNNLKHHEKKHGVELPALPLKENTCKRNPSLLVKRPSHTLLELIQMSRRINCARKAVQVKKHSFSMEFMRMFGCCFTGVKAQPRYKLH